MPQSLREVFAKFLLLTVLLRLGDFVEVDTALAAVPGGQEQHYLYAAHGQRHIVTVSLGLVAALLVFFPRGSAPGFGANTLRALLPPRRDWLNTAWALPLCFHRITGSGFGADGVQISIHSGWGGPHAGWAFLSAAFAFALLSRFLRAIPPSPRALVRFRA